MNTQALVEAEAVLEKAANTVSEMVDKGAHAAKAVRFPDKKSYLEADAALAEINRIINHINDKRMDLTRPLDAVKAEIKAAADAKIKPLSDVKFEIGAAMKNYAVAEIKWKREEQKRIDDEAKKKAEDEKLALAIEAEKRGLNAAADKIIEAPLVVKKQTVETAQSQARSSTVTLWKARIVDVKKFLHACADEPNYVDFVSIEDGELNRYAQATKGKNPVPGIEFYEDVQIRSGR